MLSEADKARFFSKIQQADGDGCWLWIGSIDRPHQPKAMFAIKGKNQPARRVAYELYFGHLPEDKLILTRCGQPLCMRPDHLFAGTYVDRTHAIVNPFDRFWGKVEKHGENDCWEWTGKFANGGYGQFTIGRKKIRAHRFILEHYRGRIPEELCVLHRCDNPRCVNPQHLFLGTRTTNSNDKVAKGRHPRGNRYRHAVLNPAVVKKIRSLYSPGQHGFGCQRIGNLLGLNPGTVSNVLRGKAWKHVV